MTNASPSGQIRRIALLIDAENVGASSEVVKNILRTIDKHGQIVIRRIYGDWSNPGLKGWHNVVIEHALETRHSISKPGKNSTDIALVIDAMDILHSGDVDAFCLVASDSDYAALATRIRRHHQGVVGVGRRDTHISFVKACTGFLYLEDMSEAQPPAKNPIIQKVVPDKPVITAKVPGSQDKKSAKLYALSQKAMNLTAAPTGWVHLSEFRNRLYEIKPDFNQREYSERSKLSDMIKEYPKLFEIKIQDKVAMIKLRSWTA